MISIQSFRPRRNDCKTRQENTVMHTKTKTNTDSLKIIKVHKTKKSTKTEPPPQNGQQPNLLRDFIVLGAWCSCLSHYLLIGV